jgi:hypothetical protein
MRIFNNKSSLPEKIQSQNDDLQNNKIALEKIQNENFSKISTIIEKTITIDQNSSASSSIFFVKAIKNTYSSNTLAASSIITYSNLLNITSSSTVSSLYEHIRGYIYRPVDWASYISSSRGPYIISSSTTGLPTLPSICGALTGIRTIFINKKIFNDSIKPNTLRISILPINTNLLADSGLKFNNSNINDSSSGQYASITGLAGLSGSLSSGINGNVVTAFTIAIKFKPINSGPNEQVLIHRRIADSSLTSLGYSSSVPGTNSNIITEKYGNLNPLLAVVNGSTLDNTLNWHQIDPGNQSDLSPATASYIKIVNRGGGQLNWAASANVGGSINWLSLSSSITSGKIYGIDNQTSTTATITAYTNNNISLANNDTGTIVFYNTSIEKCHNLPLNVTISLTIA